jgi:hypothetical protein
MLLLSLVSTCMAVLRHKVVDHVGTNTLDSNSTKTSFIKTISSKHISPQALTPLVSINMKKETKHVKEDEPNIRRRRLPHVVTCRCDPECPRGMQCHSQSSTCRVLNRLPQPCKKPLSSCKCDRECPRGMQCHSQSGTCRVLNRQRIPCGKN